MKRFLALFMCYLLFPILPTWAASYKIAVAAEDFEKNLGTWTLTAGPDGAMNDQLLQGHTNSVTAGNLPAETGFISTQAGKFKMFVRSKDHDTYPGTRHFEIAINHKNVNVTYGVHGVVGWKWEDAVEVELVEGVNTITIYDSSSSYARFGGLLFQKEDKIENAESSDQLKRLYDENKPQITAPSPPPPPKEIIARTDGKIGVVLNDEDLDFSVAPIMQNNRVLVPMRSIFQAVGAQVEWDGEKRRAVAEKGLTKIVIPIDSDRATINEVTALLDAPAIIHQETTMVPVRFICEALDAQVDWVDSAKTVVIKTKSDGGAVSTNDYFLTYNSFDDLGTWFVEQYKGSFDNANLKGEMHTDPSKTRPAVANIYINEPGEYQVWVHARDFAQNQQGSRFFNLAVNGQQSALTAGQHGKEGFSWEDAGVFTLSEGINKIEMIDTSAFYARCDGIYISKRLNAKPSDAYATIVKRTPPIIARGKTVPMPEYVKEEGNLLETLSIKNQNVKVDFYQMEKDGKTYIQRLTSVEEDGQWIEVDKQEDGLAYLIMYAEATASGGMGAMIPVYDQMIDGENVKTSFIYESGIPHWAVPTDMRMEDGKVVMNAYAECADLEIVWEIPEGAMEPRVGIKADIKRDGAYSIGIFNTPEFTNDSYENLLLPFKMDSKRMSKDPTLVNEQFAFTPMSVVTIPDSLSPVEGQPFTYGLAVDPKSINTAEWIYVDNSKFGLGIKGTNGGTQPSIFAPLFGVTTANFKQGDVYDFYYRPIAYRGDWYDAFKHVTTDILKMGDYRTNYYTSMTEATFNTTKLMLDDFYGGWDQRDKQHYNMEGRNTTSQGNPMQALQSYLLTEDEEILRKRAIPTLAALLTRSKIHFYQGGLMEGTTPYFFDIFKEGEPTPIGDPITGFNTSTFGGTDYLTFGLIPYLRKIAVGDGSRAINAYGSIPAFGEKIWFYKFTGNKTYYDQAIEEADKYLEEVVYGVFDTLTLHESFIYISYYPHLQALIDMYEASKEQRYLDAAEYVARRITTCVWTPGLTDVDKDDTMIIKAEDVKKKTHVGGTTFWWSGDFQWRLGSPIGKLGLSENIDTLKDEEVPIWLPSRVGLGIEQASTFGQSSNIIMQNWAPELMRLSHLTGDEFFATIARNALVGRFSNYPGYYQYQNTVEQMKPNYPYEGPDLTSIYFHHIPTFLAMVQDFLVSQAYSWSGGNIDFPYVRSQGYAYFVNRQYGFAPGNFFNEKDMWLWLKEGVLESDNIKIDYITARKNDVLCIALMNEDQERQRVTIKLGDEIPNASTINTTATVYKKDGSTEQIQIVNGTFTIEMEPRTFTGVKIDVPGLKEPGYAQLSRLNLVGKDAPTDGVQVDFDFGKALSLQMDNDRYFAYIYLTESDKDVQVATLEYTIDGVKKMDTCEQYPYEFIIEVDAQKDFAFTVKTDISKKSASGTLRSRVKNN